MLKTGGQKSPVTIPATEKRRKQPNNSKQNAPFLRWPSWHLLESLEIPDSRCLSQSQHLSLLTQSTAQELNLMVKAVISATWVAEAAE